MTCWQTIKRKKNGALIGAEKAWLYKEAAEYFIERNKDVSTFARETWYLKEVSGEMVSDHIFETNGRRISLDKSTKTDVVRYYALQKLTPEEKQVLGITV